MESNKKFSEKKKNIWISLTAYRTLFVLKLLIQKDRSFAELAELLENNQITRKSVSKDTVKLTINTLKEAGCDISKPNKSTGYKFVLHSHPFKFVLSDDEFNILMKMRDCFVQELSWDKVFILNDLFKKIMSISSAAENVEYVANTQPLLNVDKHLVEEFEKLISLGKKVQIKYNSPTNGEENLDIVPKKIAFENSNLYLLAYSFKYNENSLFNFSRIKKINTVYLQTGSLEDTSYEVVYKVFGISASTFELKDNEVIISENSNELTVKAKVYNEFSFVQRILLFGADFKIVSPYSFREKLYNLVKQVQKGYENGKIE